MNDNILDRLATDLIAFVIDRCVDCHEPDPCQFHAGFIDGVVALVATIEKELAKVGYVGP